MSKKLHILLHKYYLSAPRKTKRWIFRFIDLLFILLSLYIAFALRFDLFEAWRWIKVFMPELILFVPVKLATYWIIGVYRPVVRYAGEEFLLTAVKATIASTGLLALIWLLMRFPSLPRLVFILDAINSFLFLTGARIIIRWLIYHLVKPINFSQKAESIIIYGAGSTGNQLLHSLHGDTHYKIIAFVDDDPELKNQIIHGVTVYPPNKLKDLVDQNQVDSILIAIPTLGRKEKNRLVKELEELDLPIKTVPDMSDIISGKIALSDIRKVDILDLLGRDEVAPVPELLTRNISEKVVLVSGAGGSIGSELCRQIAKIKPSKLVLLEQNEFALYTIEGELVESFPELSIIPCLGSVTNASLMEQILSENQVQTIYHAAAYKHVPLVEANPAQGVLNNVIGTYTLAQSALNTGIETFVLISTDKAVRPTNVMGATKRVAEQVLQALAETNEHKTRFIMVRFGNVLDSAGSVVPRFRQQIKEGKNITLTHPEITRYFMSIPEAARLVIQAGSMGSGGDVYLLDMGEPVKIIDLAKQMIKLSGLKIGEDIDIEITGLRPGEKLYEELLINHKNAEGTNHPKIFSAKEHFIAWPELQTHLNTFKEAAEQGDKDKILTLIKTVVPEYVPQEN
jgi:FlaA1/EpsC-like NDP-sugar epimerase